MNFLFFFWHLLYIFEKPEREYWVHPFLSENKDALPKFMKQIKKYPDKFKNFLRMRIDTFEFILNLCQADLLKQNTNYRKSFTLEEKLFLTIR